MTPKQVTDPHRLEILHSLNLLDTPAEESFDRLTRLASMIVGTPVSLVSIIDSDRQFYKSLFGVPEPIASARETSLSYSLCQYVLETSEPLVADDTREHERLKDNLAVSELNALAYLGMPLTTTEGVALGSFCVIDIKPREWQPHEIEIMRELACSVMTEIELKAQIASRKEAEAQLIERNTQYRRAYFFANNTLQYMKGVLAKGADRDELSAYIEQMEQELSRI